MPKRGGLSKERNDLSLEMLFAAIHGNEVAAEQVRAIIAKDSAVVTDAISAQTPVSDEQGQQEKGEASV